MRQLWTLLLVGLLLSGAWAQAGTIAAPTGLTVTTPGLPLGVSQLELHWERVPGAVGYEVFQWRGNRWWFNEEDANRTPMTTSTTITNLDPGSSYEFCVRAVGEAGTVSPMGPSSGGKTMGTPRTAEVTPPPPTTPGGPDKPPPTGPLPKASRLDPPSSLFAVFPEQDRVRLTWRKVPLAVRYVIEEEKDGVWKPANNVVGATESNSVVLIEHPTPGPYFFRVRAFGPAGTISEPSWVIKVER